MTIGNIRFTVLQVVNEVQRKLGIDSTGTLTANKIAIELVDHINDTVDDLSDFGNWMETLATCKVTALTSVRDYTISTSGVVKNIGDIYLGSKSGPLNSVNIDTMRVMTQVTARGQPSQYCIYGTDSNGNPVIRVRPTPDASVNGNLFSILYYLKPSIYTTADTNTVIPYPARVVVLGTLAKYTLRESGGAPTELYQMFYNQYLEARKTAINRFQGDTGWDVGFAPSRIKRWRR